MEWLIMPRLPALCAELDGASMKLVRQRSEVLASRLRDLQIDVGIIREDALVAPLKSELVVAFGYALFVPKRLAGSERTLRKWLPNVPVIAPSEGWTREQIDSVCSAARIPLRIGVEGASATLAVRALREGHYGAILPDLAAPSCPDRK